MLNDDQIEELRVKNGGKVGVIDWSLPDGMHRMVFKRPTRDLIRDYRRKLESPSEKADALDQLAQATIIAYDDMTDPNKARVEFTGKLLEEAPGFTGSIKVLNVLSVLAGMIEDQEATELGKGVSVRNCPPKRTETGSSSASAA